MESAAWHDYPTGAAERAEVRFLNGLGFISQVSCVTASDPRLMSTALSQSA